MHVNTLNTSGVDGLACLMMYGHEQYEQAAKSHGAMPRSSTYNANLYVRNVAVSGMK